MNFRVRRDYGIYHGTLAKKKSLAYVYEDIYIIKVSIKRTRVR